MNNELGVHTLHVSGITPSLHLWMPAFETEWVGEAENSVLPSSSPSSSRQDRPLHIVQLLLRHDKQLTSCACEPRQLIVHHAPCDRRRGNVVKLIRIIPLIRDGE